MKSDPRIPSASSYPAAGHTHFVLLETNSNRYCMRFSLINFDRKPIFTTNPSLAKRYFTREIATLVAQYLMEDYPELDIEVKELSYHGIDNHSR